MEPQLGIFHRIVVVGTPYEDTPVTSMWTGVLCGREPHAYLPSRATALSLGLP